MCATYTPSPREQLEKWFHVAAPDSDFKAETYPGYMAPIIRPPRHDAVLGDRACALGMFGMVPSWAKDTKIARNTYNCRSETIATKPTFQNAWKRGQFCIVPAQAMFEPHYFTEEKSERWRIQNVDGDPIGIAAIWEVKHFEGLPDVISFSMLTINADGHEVMQQFHQPKDEKRMVVILRPDQYDAWMHCPVEDAPNFFVRYPAEKLMAHAVPKPSGKTGQDTLPL
jgi:putative SOS response-associated peptidase YedK